MFDFDFGVLDDLFIENDGSQKRLSEFGIIFCYYCALILMFENSGCFRFTKKVSYEK